MKTPQFLLRILQFARTLGKGTASRRTGRASFPGIRLSGDLCRGCVCGWWPFSVDLVMTGLAEHEGLAPLCCHEPGPGWLAVAGTCEVGEPGDVVHLHRAAVLAQLARAPQEPGDDLLAGVDLPAGSAVGEDRGFAPFEGDASEPCDQGFLVPVADADGLEAGARPVRGLDDGLVAGRRLGHARAVLGRERLQQRG